MDVMPLQKCNRESKTAFFIAYSSLVLFFLSDLAFKLLEKYGYGLVPIPLMVRACYEFIFIAYVLFYINKMRLYVLMFILVFFVCFIVSRFGVLVDVGVPEVYLSLILFNKYIFAYIITITFYKLRMCESEIYKLRNLIGGLFVFNAVISILGLLLNIESLATYPTDSTRFGYNGVFWSANESGYFSILSLLFFYWHVFVKNNKNKTSYGFLLLVSAAAIINGTKASILAVFIISLYFLIYEKNKNRLMSTLIVIVACISAAFLSYNLYNSDYFSYFVWMYNNNDFITMFLSARNLYIRPFFYEYIASNWSGINYLFGGHRSSSPGTELEFLDMILNFGFIGMLMYLVSYYLLIVRSVPASRFKYLSVLLLLAASVFSGHFFDSAINAMYVCLFMLIISSPVFKIHKGCLTV